MDARPDIDTAERARRAAIAATLAELWDSAASGAGLCAPGCSCGAGMLFSIGAGEIEADVTAFLESRFTAEADPALARVIASRVLAAAWGSAPFGTWLRSLAEASLDTSSFDRLADNLRTILQSLGDAGAGSGPTSRFACT